MFNGHSTPWRTTVEDPEETEVNTVLRFLLGLGPEDMIVTMDE
jgi:hypothetical protein